MAMENFEKWGHYDVRNEYGVGEVKFSLKINWQQRWENPTEWRESSDQMERVYGRFVSEKKEAKKPWIKNEWGTRGHDVVPILKAYVVQANREYRKGEQHEIPIELIKSLTTMDWRK